MKYLLVCLCITVCSISSAFAQQDSVVIPDPNKYAFSYHGYLSPFFGNYTFTNLGSMRGYLKSQNLKAPSFQFPFYFGGAYQWKRWKIGSDLIVALPGYKKTNDSGIATQHRFSSLATHVGYAFVYERNRVWFINIGIGTQTNYIDFEKSQQNQVLEMKDLLSSSQAGSSPSLFHNSTFYEISIEQIFRPKRTFTLCPALRAGFRVGTKKSPWQAASVTIKDAPIDRLYQVYLQTIIAISASKKRKEITAK